VTDLKFYPDRPQMEDIKSGDGITSNRREKAAIIPNQPGSYVLPEVSVSWWNTVTDRLEHAVVPEHTIQVLPATGTANTPAGVPSMVPAPPARPSPVQEKAENTPGKEPSPPVAQDLNIWKWTTLLLITVWLVTLLMWRAQTGKKGAVTRDKSSHAGTDRPAQLVRNVLAACDRNDPVRTKTGLMDWSKAVWPGDPPQGIGDIAARTGPGLAPELIRLNQALYSRQSHGWDGRELKRLFSREAGNFTPQRGSGGPDEGRLEPLFRIN
jgi:hypothetical protein